MVTEVIDWLELASVLGPDRTYRQADARTVELCKYMENCWLAGQVLFANEFARIARVMENRLLGTAWDVGDAMFR